MEQLDRRMESVEQEIADVKENMATKADIKLVLDAIAAVKVDTAGPIAVYTTSVNVGKGMRFVGLIIAAVFGAAAAVFGAITAWRQLG